MLSPILHPPLYVVGISGSPTDPSRSTVLLRHALKAMASSGAELDEVSVRDLPALALQQAEFANADVAHALAQVARADVVLVSTPIYKAAYSGLLKSFLDLLPQDGLRGKVVLPLATGGSSAHLLALDYALKPVLGALGARHILDAVFATDDQFDLGADQQRVPHASVLDRIDRALWPVVHRTAQPLGPLTPLLVRQMTGTSRMPC